MHPESCSSSNVEATVNACVIDEEESDSQTPDLLCRAQILNDSPRSSSMSSALDELFSHEVKCESIVFPYTLANLNLFFHEVVNELSVSEV